jgi:hypothetical protein
MSESIVVWVNGNPVCVAEGSTVAVALLVAGLRRGDP